MNRSKWIEMIASHVGPGHFVFRMQWNMLTCIIVLLAMSLLVNLTQTEPNNQTNKLQYKRSNNSTVNSNRLREVFQLPSLTKTNTFRMPSTFRPSSAVLYLKPAKPRHIASIHSELTSIDFSETNLIIKWKVVVVLRNQARLSRQVPSGEEDARVEEESNALRWDIYLRQYGFSHRRHFVVSDEKNTLDPPVTNNQTYQYMIDGLQSNMGYEFCLKSVNSGTVRESEQFKQQFPVTAYTDLASKQNPLFLCKEIVTPKVDQGVIDRRNSSGQQFSGRSVDTQSTSIQISEDAADSFVLYTAISSGSTTFLVLVVIVIFCCCRCGQKKQRQTYLYEPAGGLYSTPY